MIAALTAIAVAEAQIGNLNKAIAILDEVKQIAVTVSQKAEDVDYAHVLATMAATASEIGEIERATTLVQEALNLAARVEKASNKGRILLKLVSASANTGNWRQARSIAERNISDEDRLMALYIILRVWGERDVDTEPAEPVMTGYHWHQ